MWQHRVCGTGITRTEYRQIARGLLGDFDWFCRDCPLPTAHSSLIQEVSLRDPEETDTQSDPTDCPLPTGQSSLVHDDSLHEPQETDPQPAPNSGSFNISLPFEPVQETPMEVTVDEPIPDVLLADQATTYRRWIGQGRGSSCGQRGLHLLEEVDN